jgi:tRNA-specific 2-thiouridylase
MSGGVDSSMAALLLKEGGHRVVGVTLKLIGDELDDPADQPGRSCCS